MKKNTGRIDAIPGFGPPIAHKKLKIIVYYNLLIFNMILLFRMSKQREFC